MGDLPLQETQIVTLIQKVIARMYVHGRQALLVLLPITQSRNKHRSIRQCSEGAIRLNICCGLWVNTSHRMRTNRHIPGNCQTHVVHTRLIVEVLVESFRSKHNRPNYINPKSPDDSPSSYPTQPPQVSAELETLGSSRRVWE